MTDACTCSDCPWFSRTQVKAGFGRCFRRAPVLVMNHDGTPKTYRPSVHENDPVCGESPYYNDVLDEFFEEDE